jgi:hypothetical protein
MTKNYDSKWAFPPERPEGAPALHSLGEREFFEDFPVYGGQLVGGRA